MKISELAMNPTPKQVASRNARIAKINLQIRELQQRTNQKISGFRIKIQAIQSLKM